MRNRTVSCDISTNEKKDVEYNKCDRMIENVVFVEFFIIITITTTFIMINIFSIYFPHKYDTSSHMVKHYDEHNYRPSVLVFKS